MSGKYLNVIEDFLLKHCILVIILLLPFFIMFFGLIGMAFSTFYYKPLHFLGSPFFAECKDTRLMMPTFLGLFSTALIYSAIYFALYYTIKMIKKYLIKYN